MNTPNVDTNENKHLFRVTSKMVANDENREIHNSVSSIIHCKHCWFTFSLVPSSSLVFPYVIWFLKYCFKTFVAFVCIICLEHTSSIAFSFEIMNWISSRTLGMLCAKTSWTVVKATCWSHRRHCFVYKFLYVRGVGTARWHSRSHGTVLWTASG